jgi:dihydroxyacid dehydratase/phosphogluconate dehydratase
MPEAYPGEPIALVEEGDTINIDIPEGKVELQVSPAVLEARRQKWRPPDVTRLVAGSLLELSADSLGRA